MVRLTDGWKLLAVDADHAQPGDFASPAQVEQREADDADFLVRPGGTTAHEASGILAGSDLG